MYTDSRQKKYIRDGIQSRHVKTYIAPRTVEGQEVERKCEPINLTDQEVDKGLVKLCSRGPSFVPMPTNVDWNDLQQSWQDFKRKVRWRAFFYLSKSTPKRCEYKPLEAPYQKSSKEPPKANPAIEVYLNSVEKDLFNGTISKVPDNLTPDERGALKQFRTTPVEERNLVIRIQDKGNSFVFLNKYMDNSKVKEQMDRGSFRILERDISEETCSEVLRWTEKWRPYGLSEK